MAKRYYWLKLKEDFFEQRVIKKLRKIAGGDTYTIIYLKLQLLAMKNDGKIAFEGVEEDFATEMALALDEEEENVKITLMYLEKNKLIETLSDEEFLLPQVLDVTGSESASTIRSRESRERKKMLQCNTTATQCNNVQQIWRVEKEKEKEKDSNIINNNNNIIEQSTNINFSSGVLQEINLLLNGNANLAKRVMKLNKPMERIKEVIQFSNRYEKGDGWLYLALKEDWELKEPEKRYIHPDSIENYEVV